MRSYQPDVTNSADILDSRDVVARIRELEEERDDLSGTVDERQETLAAAEEDAADSESEEYTAEIDAVLAARTSLADAQDALQEWDQDNAAELEALKKLEAEAEGYSDWQHGVQLIRDSYFDQYARSTAEEMHGSSVANASWPFSCIDWEQAANELKQDYTSVSFDGVDYWIRS